jgi:TPR repeat protein
MEPLRVNTSGITATDTWPAERRRRARNRIFTPAYASFNGANALDLHEILDLSEDGFAAQAPPTIDFNQRVSLRLVLSETESPVSAHGRVVWSDRGRIGIELETLPPEDLQHLQRWLFLNAMNAAGDAAGNEEHPRAVSSVEEPSVLADHSSLLNAFEAVRREVLSLALEPDAALRLVAERTVAFTGASGCAVAVLAGDTMICRASSGDDAPPIGATFHSGSGFSGECVRRAAMLRCDDAEIDPHVDQQSCRALGIRSILAAPLLSGDSVIGLVEVFSPKHSAFRDRDEEVLTRMAEFALAIVEPAQDTTATHATSFPFSDTLNPDARKFPLRKSHVILLVAALALAAWILGYLLAPWLQRLFTNSPKTPSKATLTTPAAPQPVALKGTPGPAVGQATTLDQLRSTAERGDASAQFGLGAHYAIGDGVKLDNVEAARWFSKAAEQGHVIAQDTLGAYYWAGRGVPKDLRKAYFWSLLGRAGNNETSKYRVVALNALLPRDQIEGARQEAEQWIRLHPPATPSHNP